jgi:hypothetical protein
MSEIPLTFTLKIGPHTYFVERMPHGEPDASIGPVVPAWAYRVEGERDRGVFHGVPVIDGETFSELKARLTALLTPQSRSQ